jgi:hypothetical protein
MAVEAQSGASRDDLDRTVKLESSRAENKDHLSHKEP